MNRNDLFRGFQEIDDKLLERSEIKKAKVIYVWKKWAALAACLCMVVVAIPYVRNFIFSKGNGDSQIDVPEIALCYYQGALYECCNNKDGLERAGLPSKITSEMAGDHVAYVELGDHFDYQITSKQTDKEILQYAPAPSRSVYILRTGEDYMALLFCRTYFPDDPNAYSDLAEVYRFFGITGASDIDSICETNWNTNKIVGKEVTDENSIKEFYDMTTDIRTFISMDNDAFQDIVFNKIPEEQQQQAHNAFADDLHMIRIRTKSGLQFYVSYYPNYGFLYSGHAMAYHQVTSEMEMWFHKYMKIK